MLLREKEGKDTRTRTRRRGRDQRVLRALRRALAEWSSFVQQALLRQDALCVCVCACLGACVSVCLCVSLCGTRGVSKGKPTAAGLVCVCAYVRMCVCVCECEMRIPYHNMSLKRSYYVPMMSLICP